MSSTTVKSVTTRMRAAVARRFGGPDVEVIAMLGARFGGHAEYACVNPATSAVTRKPRSLGFEEAVALVFGGHTALAYLDHVQLEPGAEVLVNGASGAVGTAVVQLAKQRGARVTAVCSGGNAELVTSLGADRVIDYPASDFAAGGERYDVIVDCVGNAPFSRVEHSITSGGALLLVVAGLHAMLTASRDSRRSGKLVTMVGTLVDGDELASIVRLAESGEFRPVIDRTYDLAQGVGAHRYVDTGRKRGNVVLRIA